MIWHPTGHHPLRQSLYDGSLADPGARQEHRVVFSLAPQNHYHPFDLALPADQPDRAVRCEPASSGPRQKSSSWKVRVIRERLMFELEIRFSPTVGGAASAVGAGVVGAIAGMTDFSPTGLTRAVM